MIQSGHDVINSDAAEIMCRRVYAIWKAFDKVAKLSDWKQPKGAGKWRSKAQRHLADEYDAIALENGELQVDEADEE
eukprot:10142368-Alexandrium_andersonii.AAC.1